MSSTLVAAPTRSEFRSLKECKTLGEAFGCGEFLDRIKQSAPAHVKPQRMLRTFIQATSRTPDLLKCNMRSVLGAMLTCSEVGLEPNTPLQHAFLIPFARSKWNPQTRQREDMGHEVQLIFGYPGLLDLAFRSGHVTSVHADVVWTAESKDKGRFSFAYGTDAHLRHVPMGHHEDLEKPVWVYAHANLTNGQAFEVMPWADVIRIRNQSQGFQAALRAKEQGEGSAKPYIPRSWTDAPWVKHEVPMAKKTAFRSLWKWLPHSVELAGALALDEQQDRGTVDFGAVIDGNASIMGGGFEEGDTIEGEAKDATATFTDRREPPTQASNPPALSVVGSNPPAPPVTQTVTQTSARETATNVELDSSGVAWDERLHASSKARNTNGTWRARRGVDKTQATNDDTPPSEGGLFGGEPEQQPDAPVQQTTAPTQPAGFSEWLTDYEGEAIPDEDGVIEAYTDPVKFAHAYVNARDSTFPADLERFESANHDGVVRAMIASTLVSKIVAGGAPEARRNDPPVNPGHVPPPASMTKPDLDRYKENLKAALDSATTPDAINAIIEANDETYNKFPPKLRMECKALVEARQIAISPAPSRDAPVQSIEDFVDGILADIASIDSIDMLATWKAYPKAIAEIERVAREAPDLHERIVQAITKRETELKVTAISEQWDGKSPKEVFDALVVQLKSQTTLPDLIAFQQQPSVMAGGKVIQASSPDLWKKFAAAYQEHKKSLGG